MLLIHEGKISCRSLSNIVFFLNYINLHLTEVHAVKFWDSNIPFRHFFVKNVFVDVKTSIWCVKQL